ncbi:MAG: hypothetical protein EZS28_049097, partial [Streblomastix strix]
MQPNIRSRTNSSSPHTPAIQNRYCIQNDFINPDPLDIEITKIDKETTIIRKKEKYQYSVVSLEKVIDEGIWQFEAQFQNISLKYASIGIVKASHKILANCSPHENPGLNDD